jgi:hypothetical protein
LVVVILSFPWLRLVAACFVRLSSSAELLQLEISAYSAGVCEALKASIAFWKARWISVSETPGGSCPSSFECLSMIQNVEDHGHGGGMLTSFRQ